MTASSEPPFGIVRVAPFAGLVHRFDELIGSSTTMALYFIHSRRWRENHDAAIKAFLSRAGTTLEAFLPARERLRQARSSVAVRPLPDVLLLPVRSARGDCPVFQHRRQEGAAGVRDHREWRSGRVPRGRHRRLEEGVSQAGPAGSGSRD